MYTGYIQYFLEFSLKNLQPEQMNLANKVKNDKEINGKLLFDETR